MSVPQSLVLITVDCLRADHVGFLGYDRPTTPFLDSLAAESTVFHNAIAAGVPTYYSFPAIMASRYPLALGRDVIGLAPGEPTLASTLQEAGYATAAFVAGNPYLSKRFGYGAGFEQYEDFLQGDIGLDPSPSQPTRLRSRVNSTVSRFCHKVGPLGRAYDELYFQYCQRVAIPATQSFDQLRRYPAADAMVDSASRWLENTSNRPVFLWLHLMDPHAPFYPPEEAQRVLGPVVSASRAHYLNASWNRRHLRPGRLEPYKNELLHLYDCGIRWVDTQLARLVTQLQKSGLWENSAFALTADHGEEFLERGDRFHSPANLHDELARVPLLIRVPNKPSQDLDLPFSLLHLPATLLDAVNVPRPARFRGSPVASQIGERRACAVTEGLARFTNPQRTEKESYPRVIAIRELRYKLVFDLRSHQEQLFDLHADPGEMQPLPAGAEKAIRRRLLDYARQHLADCLSSRNPEDRLSLLLDDFRAIN